MFLKGKLQKVLRHLGLINVTQWLLPSRHCFDHEMPKNDNDPPPFIWRRKQDRGSNS